jgi:hypothetical protein
MRRRIAGAWGARQSRPCQRLQSRIDERRVLVKYRGFEFTVTQTANPTGWKWVKFLKTEAGKTLAIIPASSGKSPSA